MGLVIFVARYNYKLSNQAVIQGKPKADDYSQSNQYCSTFFTQKVNFYQ